MQDPPIADVARAERPPGDDAPNDGIDDAPNDGFDNERAWILRGAMHRDQPTAFSSPPPYDQAAPQAESRFLVDWVDQHRETPHPADPAYPAGTAIDVALDAMKACRVQLAYPAARCGLWVITCRVCGYAIALATAGRADDPCSVRVPCRLH